MVPALQSCVSQKSTVTGVPPRRRGQHFLVDAEVVHRIMEAAQIQPYESVLEIGPGKGALTRGLIERARSVLAVEIDGALFRKLEMEFTNSNNLRLLREDILHVSFSELVRWAGSPKLVVVGNLPYYITSPVVSKLVDNHMFVERAILMVQREVGRRITAAPGSKSYGMLSVMVQLRAEPRLLFDIPPNYFQPKPRVYSSLLRLSFR
ncbi:MAG: ribosomal RNA small subunit methyltransferase A, partial [Candidatus Latescibacterota bacterium]